MIDRNKDAHAVCDEFVNSWSPERLFNELTKTVYGNEDTLRQISVLVYGWMKRIDRADEPHGMNFFLTGESGSGKTTLCRALQQILPCPVLLKDSTTITATGFKGADANTLVDDDDYFAFGGFAVVFLDELDKRLTPEYDSHGYSTSESVTNVLLRMVEGGEVRTPSGTVDTHRTAFYRVRCF